MSVFSGPSADQKVDPTPRVLRDRLPGLGRAETGLMIAIAGLLALALILYLTRGVNFFRPSNLSSISRSLAILSVVSLGQLVVIISGGFDLSVGSVMSTTGVIAAFLMGGQDSLVAPVALVCLAFGGAVGFVNGLIITKRSVQPFVMTLGMMIVLDGARLIMTKGVPTGAIPDLMQFAGKQVMLGIPILVWVLIPVAAIFWILLRKSRYGRELYAIGSNAKAALLAGVRTDRAIIITYMLCSMAAVLAGLMLAGWGTSTGNWAGQGFELDSIAAVALGGAAIGGGQGYVLPTILGVFILESLTSLSVMFNLPPDAKYIVKGLIIILAVWAYSRRSTT